MEMMIFGNPSGGGRALNGINPSCGLASKIVSSLLDYRVGSPKMGP